MLRRSRLAEKLLARVLIPACTMMHEFYSTFHFVPLPHFAAGAFVHGFLLHRGLSVRNPYVREWTPFGGYFQHTKKKMSSYP
ncbi:protein of unknown function [Candidatus Filomicrobium marinum]|uniref:Uncharacterized protein n=1 Tax=Candidatus Filomicrobium marinum TaxID=1608628 RepID=A0A0D6JJY8_9HYPH|nr:protein of unknown function [Candidatus Filomicrobium marinum]CPR22304.1 protein of unknown function [Candidatus Filomicrobium marinum]